MQSSVLGQWKKDVEPCMPLIPCMTRWKHKQFSIGSWSPCSIWRALTPERYTLIDEWWMDLARNFPTDRGSTRLQGREILKDEVCSVGHKSGRISFKQWCMFCRRGLDYQSGRLSTVAGKGGNPFWQKLRYRCWLGLCCWSHVAKLLPTEVGKGVNNLIIDTWNVLGWKQEAIICTREHKVQQELHQGGGPWEC